jgi:hypothetical protein
MQIVVWIFVTIVLSWLTAEKESFTGVYLVEVQEQGRQRTRG